MGQLTDALKSYKENHPQIGLAENSFKMTPLHAHIYNSMAGRELFSSRTDPPDGQDVANTNFKAHGTPKAKTFQAIREMGQAGLMDPHASYHDESPEEVYKAGNDDLIASFTHSTTDKGDKVYSDHINGQ